MPKAGEISYLNMIGPQGIAHALNKPFSDDYCGQYLMALGAMRLLLPRPPARLLDLGCGTGWTSCLFAQMGYDVVGQDIAPDMIHYAQVNKQRYGVDKLAFSVSDYEDLCYGEEFDCAVFFDSLHHAEDEWLALEKTCRALKPGGVCITREPGEGHAKAEASRRAVQKYGVTEKNMPPYKIIAIARAVGFRTANVYPFPDLVIAHYEALTARLAAKQHAKRKSPVLCRPWLDKLFPPEPRRGMRCLRRMLKPQQTGGLVALRK